MNTKNIKVTATEKIIIDESDSLETELREMTKEELLHRLNYEESDPKTIKLIKKILKDKQ